MSTAKNTTGLAVAGVTLGGVGTIISSVAMHRTKVNADHIEQLEKKVFSGSDVVTALNAPLPPSSTRELTVENTVTMCTNDGYVKRVTGNGIKDDGYRVIFPPGLGNGNVVCNDVSETGQVAVFKDHTGTLITNSQQCAIKDNYMFAKRIVVDSTAPTGPHNTVDGTISCKNLNTDMVNVQNTLHVKDMVVQNSFNATAATTLMPLASNSSTGFITSADYTKFMSLHQSVVDQSNDITSLNTTVQDHDTRITNNTSAIGILQDKNTSTKVAIGSDAGIDKQGEHAVAIGNSAGAITQGTQSIAIGFASGNNGQMKNAVAIGSQAGIKLQGEGGIAIGFESGKDGQMLNAVAIGTGAGKVKQSTQCVSVGFESGNEGQMQNAVAVGNSAGKTQQGKGSVAVGLYSGFQNQADDSIAIGTYAGAYTQGRWSVAIGVGSGIRSQKAKAVAIGLFAGGEAQGEACVAIGANTAHISQQENSIAIGHNTVKEGQGPNSIAMGSYACSKVAQGSNSVVVGYMACQSGGQGDNSVAIGSNIVGTQGAKCVALGSNMVNTQNTESVCIGVGNVVDNTTTISQAAKSIIINATGTSFGTTTQGVFVAPVNTSTSNGYGRIMKYNSDTKEMTTYVPAPGDPMPATPDTSNDQHYKNSQAGSMVFNKEALYVCYDTDKWARVPLAWASW